MQWGIKWWLGLPLTPELGVCAYCPDKALDAHHAVTCKFGGDVVARHNALRNAIFDFCKRALLNPKLEAGAGLGQKKTKAGLRLDYKRNAVGHQMVAWSSSNT